MKNNSRSGKNGPITVPPPLPPGGTIGVIAPGGPVDAGKLERGMNRLRSKEYTIRRAENLDSENGFTAGTREERLRGTLRILQDPEVDTVICARGGQGTLHLVPDLVDALDDEPSKRISGYSDVTVLQMALLNQPGWVTFSGPMISTEWSGDRLSANAQQQFWNMLCSDPGEWTLDLEPNHEPEVWREGAASGRLFGGCLSMVCSLLGTSFFPNPSGKVLLLEEVNEAPYRIDRMLHHLRYAGVFDAIDGLVLGRFSGCFSEEDPEHVFLRQLIHEASRGSSFPILADVPYGHDSPSFRTFPIGAKIRLQTDPVRLNINM